MKTKLVCALVAMMSLMSVKAETYRRLPDKADWADPTSYALGEFGTTPLESGSPLPGAGDTVYVSGASTNSLFISTDDTAQWAAFNAVSCWRIKSGNRIVITVPEGQDAELTVRLNFKGWGTSYNYDDGGGIIKRGTGTLVFDTPASNKTPSNGRSYHECYVEIEQGAVALTRKAVEESYDNYMYGRFKLAAGTTLYLPRREDRKAYYRTAIWGLDGEGTVVAEDPGASVYVQGRMKSVFNGTFVGDLSLYVGGNQTFANPNNTVRSVLLHGAIEQEGGIPEWNDEGPSFVKIGNPGEPTSIGTNATIVVGNSSLRGGVLHYIGEGETSSKAFEIGRTKNHPFFLDGGAGGLTLTGAFRINALDGIMERIVLEGTGTGERESKLTGNMTGANSGEGVPCAFIVTKRGSGTWALQNTREAKGAFYVQDGTLKFDSIGETNEVSALGYSTMLTENRGIAWTNVSARVPYAFQLGATDTNNAAIGKGLMEYIGTATGRTTTREAQVNGAGGFVNNGEASFRLAGVSAGACTNNTLYLGGGGTNGNELQDLSGAMDIVKEGAGTWFLSGSNTVSGKVSVDGGTLWVRDPAKYTWFRWIIFNTYATTSALRCVFFGLYDEDGNLVNGNPTEGDHLHKLAPGEVGIDDGKYFRSDTGRNPYIEKVFGDTYTAYNDIYLNKTSKGWGDGEIMRPVSNATDRTLCFIFAIRLRDGANVATSYDFITTGTYMSSKDGAPADWMVEASADGFRWDVVAERRENYKIKSGDYAWRCANENIVLKKGETSFAVHTNGEPLIRTRRAAEDVLPVFNNVTSVKVAQGAVLKTDPGADLAIRGIEADVAGAGTIENFRIAESGTIAITGVEKGVRDFKLPVTLVNVADKANFSSWDFTINGQANSNWQMSVDKDGNVSFSKKGLVLIVR